MTIDFSIAPDPPQLDWAVGDRAAKDFKIRNIGTEPFRLVVAASGIASNDFVWSGVQAELQPGATRPVTVAPPLTGTGQRTANLAFEVRDLGNQVVRTGTMICHSDANARVGYGDLAVSALLFNPPGADLDGEGEYVELLNTTGRDLDLTGTSLSQVTFNSRGIGSEARVVSFAPDPGRVDFGRTCLLPFGKTLRILTRARRTGEGPAQSGLRYFLEQNRAIWNNTGDRATVRNERDYVVASFGYLSQATTRPNDPAPPWPVTTPTGPEPPQVVIFSTTVTVNAGDDEVEVPGLSVEDGDTITLDAGDAALGAAWLSSGVIGAGTVSLAPFRPVMIPSGQGLGILPRRLLPTEPAVATADMPIAGAPLGALLARVGGAPWMLIGGSTSPFTVTLNQPASLFLTVNDDVRWDNSGGYSVLVTVAR